MINIVGKKILKDDDIVSNVIKYIDENLYNYAVMIDGDWGCEKTYGQQQKRNLYRSY